MTTNKEVLRRVDEADIELIRLLFVNNSGVPRGRIVDRANLAGALENGANLTKAMQSFTALDLLVPDGMYGAAGEVRVTPDPDTFQVLPYDDRAAVMLSDMYTLDGTPWEADPRSQLRSLLDELAEDDFTAQTAFESEFYLLRETEDGDKVPFDDSPAFSTAGMRSAHDVILDTIDALKAQEMSIANYYPEYGPGQQELVTKHAKGISAPDNHILFKETVAATATAHNAKATFVPKPLPNGPGSGCHIHVSLWQDGENVFYDPSDKGPYGLSDTGYHFIGGLLEHAHALVALTAPTVESYDRLKPEMWASAFNCWGRDNREAVVRVPSTERSSRAATTRLEFKPSDNTSNPYLALLGLLAAGMDGVRRELDPGDPLDDNPTALSENERNERGIERLPATLNEALDELETDDVLAAAMGDALFESYLQVKRSEWEQSVDENGTWNSEYLQRGF